MTNHLDQQTLQTRLAEARHARFVGRADELALFRHALASDPPPFSVVLIHGPGGIGKTSLLHEFARVAGAAGRVPLLIDGRSIEPSPAGVLQALCLALGFADVALALDYLENTGNLVLMFDTTELLQPIADWMREGLLPMLNAGTIVVLAGRTQPGDAWSSDAGWAEMTRIVALRNLSPDECSKYLAMRGMGTGLQTSITANTYGHPLALSLLADLHGEGKTGKGDWGHDGILPQDPDIVRTLLRRFTHEVADPVHRQALEICAHVHTTTEGLLAAILGEAAGRDAFAWLQALSFIETGAQGIFPHDLARDVIEADLLWRDPQRFRAMHRQVRQPILEQIPHATGVEQQYLIHAMHFLHRNQPLMRPFFEWQNFGKLYAEVATSADFAQIEAMVLRHQGKDAAAHTRHWLRGQPEGFVVFRGADREIGGFVQQVDMRRLTQDDLAADNTVALAHAWMHGQGMENRRGAIYYYRNWMGKEEHQYSLAIHNMAAMVLLRPIFSDPEIVCSIVVSAEPELYRPVFDHIRFGLEPAMGFALDGRQYSVFAHDWRAEPMPAWIEIMGEREITVGYVDEPVPTGAPLLLLSEAEFGTAVQHALRDWTRRDLLATNPLLRSRLMRDLFGNSPTSDDLATLLHQYASDLATNPKDRKLWRALEQTYFTPAITQEQAAELLDLPFSTYRSHLVKGVARVRERLWQQELCGG